MKKINIFALGLMLAAGFSSCEMADELRGNDSSTEAGVLDLSLMVPEVKNSRAETVSTDNFEVVITDTENPENVNSINMSTNMLSMWQEPGDVTSVPKASVARTYFGYTDMYLSNAAFLRLKNLTVSYDLPQHLLKKTKVVKGVRVFATGRNLLTFTSYTGLDPEVDSNATRGAYPNPRQYTIGLEVKF